jgi:hypothetical protein
VWRTGADESLYRRGGDVSQWSWRCARVQGGRWPCYGCLLSLMATVIGRNSGSWLGDGVVDEASSCLARGGDEAS